MFGPTSRRPTSVRRKIAAMIPSPCVELSSSFMVNSVKPSDLAILSKQSRRYCGILLVEEVILLQGITCCVAEDLQKLQQTIANDLLIYYFKITDSYLKHTILLRYLYDLSRLALYLQTATVSYLNTQVLILLNGKREELQQGLEQGISEDPVDIISRKCSQIALKNR